MPNQFKDPLQAISVDIDKVLLALFEDSLEGILVTNKDAVIVMVNARTAQIFEYDQSQMLGMKVQDLIPDSVRSGHREKVETYMQSPRKRQKHIEKHLRGLTSTGKEVHLDISLNPIRIEAGQYVIAHIVDQSERGEIKQSLKESENLLHAVIENAVDGIISINSRGIISAMNPAAVRLFGYTNDEVIGNNVSMLMPEPHRSGHDSYLQNYQRTGKAKIIGIGREVEGRKKDGSLFPFYLSVSKIDMAEGHFYAGIVHDLTEQKAAENAMRKYSEDLEQRVEARTSALAQAIKGLEKEIQERKSIEKALILSQSETQKALLKERELNELKSRFVSMASHEFRTPLATILSSMNLLEKYQDPAFEDRRAKHIDRIKSNVKNLTSILNDFLSLSKLEEGKVEVQVQEIDIRALAEEVREDLKVQVKPGQEIHYKHEGTEHLLILDPRLLQNIMLNLLSNAVKYSPENTQVEFITRLEKDTFYIQVKDEGIGIPEEEMEHLFERFFRAKNATNIQGTGLGLSIIKHHIDLMDGSIQVKSILNEGTEFSLKFPRKLSRS